MPNDGDVSRREFLERVSAGAFLGAAGVSSRRSRTAHERKAAAAKPSGSGWTPPPVLKNPNILVIMVDQMRLPMWLTPQQLTTVSQTVMPNIIGQIQANSYNFGQYFINACVCTPSRACLLTGLYTPQTAMYARINAAPGVSQGTPLNPAFPTWGNALTTLNPAYGGNVWWFGKWHLSDIVSSTPLQPYGFNTRTYPGGSPYHYSPDGYTNEGSSGGLYKGTVWASDAMITSDFLGWLQGQSSSRVPWCATVSLINPHDMASAPGWVQTNPFPPPGLPVPAIYFPPAPGPPPQLYPSGSGYTPPNWENLQTVTNKPSLQYYSQAYLNSQFGAVTDWGTFLNQYFMLQNLVDQQVGLILSALYSSPFASNTIVVFTSDHGDYCGSHGLHDKGFTAYDESLRVPFYVQFPGQTGSIPVNQMCSAVDLFGFICDLATGGSGVWRLAYPDLANRESMWSYLYNNSSENRVMPGPSGVPYIFYTYDEPSRSGTVKQNTGNSHIVCMRGKLDLNEGAVGGKLAFYSQWSPCTTYPGPGAVEWDFYDYSNNASELGNDYSSNDPATQAKIQQYTQALGTLEPQCTGLVSSELAASLVGIGTDSNPLSQAQASARQAYFNYVNGTNTCPS